MLHQTLFQNLLINSIIVAGISVNVINGKRWRRGKEWEGRLSIKYYLMVGGGGDERKEGSFKYKILLMVSGGGEGRSGKVV